MQFIPEYEPVKKLYLCFVREFFDTRFHYGRAQCEIIRAAQPEVEIELLISPDEIAVFRAICEAQGVALTRVTFNHDTPARSILAEYAPIFARDEQGNRVGLTFRNPLLENGAALKDFSERMLVREGFQPWNTGMDFSTAHLLVNEDVVFLSEYFFREGRQRRAYEMLRRAFPTYHFYLVPGLAGDVTHDLDMYLWPIAPKTWVVSEYAQGTPQAQSVAPAVQRLKAHGHRVHFVPGLERIKYADVDTMPNYANGVIINRTALVPAYQRSEDRIVQEILSAYGYRVRPIDCSHIILSNSGVHCISKTIPSNTADDAGRFREEEIGA